MTMTKTDDMKASAKTYKLVPATEAPIVDEVRIVVVNAIDAADDSFIPFFRFVIWSGEEWLTFHEKWKRSLQG